MLLYPVLISFTLTDIRPNNVFVDYDVKLDGSIRVNQAQISDLGMGSMIPPGLNVCGARLENPMCCSSKSHVVSQINYSSDFFLSALL